MTRRERGMVTAETAVVLPFVVLVALTLVWVVSLGVTQARLADAARDAARAVARGESARAAGSAARELVPGARVRVRIAEGLVSVQVRHRARLPLVPTVGLGLSASAVATVE